jgi:hypothetical protein
MTFEEIRDRVIKPKLTDILGRTLADGLYTRARFATTGARGQRHKLNTFVTTVCTDPHFIGMWGTAQAARQEKEWLELFL